MGCAGHAARGWRAHRFLCRFRRPTKCFRPGAEPQRSPGAEPAATPPSALGGFGGTATVINEGYVAGAPASASSAPATPAPVRASAVQAPPSAPAAPAQRRGGGDENDKREHRQQQAAVGGADNRL